VPEESVFRFVALRQPTERPSGEKAELLRVPYSVRGEDPPLARQVLDLPLADRTRRTLVRLGGEFIAGERYVRDLSQLPFDLGPLREWVEANAAEKLSDLDPAAFVQERYQREPKKLIESEEFGDAASRLAESLFAHAISDGNGARRRDDIVNAIKLLYLVDAATSASKLFEREETLGELVASLLVVIAGLDRAPAKRGEPEVKPRPQPPGPEDAERLEVRLEKLARAHSELAAVLARPDALHTERIEPEQEVKPPAGGDGEAVRLDLLMTKLERLALKLDPSEGEEGRSGEPATGAPLAAAGTTGIVRAKPRLALARSAVGRLSTETKEVLAEIHAEPHSADPFTTINVLETEMATVSAQLPAKIASQTMIAFGGVMLNASAFVETYGLDGPMISVKTLPTEQPCQFKAGIGDLLIVRQKLIAYELGDLAHVENVLRGEFREREHRRLDLREETETVETERETEKERDLQSTERNEMQNEATKTVQSQFGLEAGLQVSGSYGPVVSFSASLNTSFSTSTAESQRKATSYSREVAEKTAERIRERVREERVRRVLEQIEEINIHRISNTDAPAGHVRGMYRWLNKLYDAQVFSYGQRMMYEFVLPEPAAYFLYAMVSNPPQDLTVEKPNPPTYYGQPLKPENLTRSNYQRYLAEQEVTSAKPPPPSFTHVSFFEKQEGKEESHYERASKITVPDDYEATSASTWYWFVHSNDKARLEVGLGGVGASGGVSFSTPRRAELSVGIHAFYTKAFVATVDVYCRLTAEGLAKWQHETYASILQAYLNRKAAYDEAIAAQKIQQGVQILGRNPLENRRIERDELRKLAIMTLSRSSYLDIDSYYDSGEPAMDLAAACQNGSYIRFLENAFEWTNMTYVHYPYFWNRHARWNEALHLTDPDPDFAAFLRAGATRVQLPVRPGFERAVAYFCQTGMPWEGNDVPLIGDDLYIPIVEEISEQLGRPEEGEPYPPESEPWGVTIPTSLVVVQDLEEIPAIVDSLTGNPMDLGG
jgi:hypothetical protein